MKNFNVRPVNKITNKLNIFVKRGKDKIKKEDQHNVVYKIECNNCNSNYIGETQRALATRTKKHKDNIGHDPKMYNVISKHRLDNDHEIKWDKVKILDVEPHYFKRKYSEMLQIKSTKNTLHIQHDTGSIISNIYNPKWNFTTGPMLAQYWGILA